MEPPVVAKPAGAPTRQPSVQQPAQTRPSYPMAYPTHPPSFQSNPPSYPAQPQYRPPYPSGHQNVQGPPGSGYVPPVSNPPYPTGGTSNKYRNQLYLKKLLENLIRN